MKKNKHQYYHYPLPPPSLPPPPCRCHCHYHHSSHFLVFLIALSSAHVFPLSSLFLSLIYFFLFPSSTLPSFPLLPCPAPVSLSLFPHRTISVFFCPSIPSLCNFLHSPLLFPTSLHSSILSNLSHISYNSHLFPQFEFSSSPYSSSLPVSFQSILSASCI